MLNLWNSGFSTIDSIHIYNNMPGGNNTSTRPVSKPGQPNPVKTVQTLLAAKKKDIRGWQFVWAGPGPGLFKLF